MTDQRLPTVGSDDGVWGDILRQYLLKEHYNGDANVTPGTSENGGHQFVTIRAGTTSAAPLTLTAGTNLTTPAAGSVEYDGTSYYLTPSSGTRKRIATYNVTGSQGDLYYRDGSNNLVPLTIGGSNTVLTVSGGVPTWQAASGDMTLAGTQTVTGTKTFNAGTLLDKGSQVVNVKSYGATGDGTTDDTSAINTAISSSPTGSTIFFPVGTYLITAPIVLYANRSYVGAGADYGSGAVIKQKNGTNMTNGAGLTGMLVARAWSTNAATCDNPITIEKLTIDGNKANNATSTACGIILTNFWSHIRDCYIANVSKDGIRLTDVTANGTNTVSNSCSENTVRSCKIDSVGGDGVRSVSNNGNSNMDGFLENNLISTVTGSGIVLDKAAGWVVRRNHLYGIGVNAIDLSKAFATLVEGNYVEDFGLQATASTWYTGISIVQLNGRGSQVVNNFVGTSEPSSSVGAYLYLLAKAGSSQTDAQVVLTGNTLHGPSSPTNKGTGLYLDVGSGGTLNVYDVGNDVRSVNTLRQSYTGVLIQRTSPTRVLSTASSATPTITIDACDQFNITALATNITSWTLSGSPTDGQKLMIRIKDDGTARSLSWGASWRAIGVSLPTTTVAGKTLYVGSVYNNADSKWDVIAVGQEA